MTEHVRTFSEPQGSPPPDERQHNNAEPATALTLVEVDTPTKAERLVSISEIAVLDTAKYDQMWRVAVAMARSSTVPLSLRAVKDGRDWKPLDSQQIVANCFRVVNQAVRWNMDPYALLDCASIIHGRLCWEGKVIAAVLDSLAGVSLRYEYAGEGDLMRVTVIGTFPSGRTEEISGDVSQWKTKGEGSPWLNPKDYPRQLAYRGAREWARRHKPSVMLGVYGTDEFVDRAAEAPVAENRPPRPPAAPPPRRAAQVGVKPPPALTAPKGEDPAPKEPAPPPAGRVAVKGEPKKKSPTFDWGSVSDTDERDWLRNFNDELEECRNFQYVDAIVDRRQRTIDRLSEEAKQLSNQIVDVAFARFRKKK